MQKVKGGMQDVEKFGRTVGRVHKAQICRASVIVNRKSMGGHSLGHIYFRGPRWLYD